MFESDNTRFDHSPLSCWLFVHGSFNVIYSTCLAMPFFDLPSTFLRALLCSFACCSPMCPLNALKRWYGSGFITLLTMFTLVSIFQMWSFLSVTRSQIWRYLTSICFFFAWYTGFQMRCIALSKSQVRIGIGWSIWLLAEKSTDNRCNQMPSITASYVAMYSNSIVERVL